MRYIYFQLSNGEAIDPTYNSIPPYRVVVSTSGKILKLEACFSRHSIINKGLPWMRRRLDRLERDWRVYKWLKQGLETYIEETTEDKKTAESDPEQYIYLQVSL